MSDEVGLGRPWENRPLRAMYLGFDDSKHWVDIYHSRIRGIVPPIQLRICTRYQPASDENPASVPGYPGYPFKLIARLLAARIAMWLHS